LTTPVQNSRICTHRKLLRRSARERIKRKQDAMRRMQGKGSGVKKFVTREAYANERKYTHGTLP
jgi:hypothetical protein